MASCASTDSVDQALRNAVTILQSMKVSPPNNTVKNVTTGFVVLAELAHIFCCLLPVSIAVMSVGGQIGLGGMFLTYHDVIHSYEIPILVGSGLVLAIGLALHYVSHRIEHPSTRYRPSKLMTLAIILFAANVTFYISSGHWFEPPRFN